MPASVHLHCWLLIRLTNRVSRSNTTGTKHIRYVEMLLTRNKIKISSRTYLRKIRQYRQIKTSCERNGPIRITSGSAYGPVISAVSIYRNIDSISIYRIAGRNIEIFDISRYQISIYHFAEFSFIYSSISFIYSFILASIWQLCFLSKNWID